MYFGMEPLIIKWLRFNMNRKNDIKTLTKNNHGLGAWIKKPFDFISHWRSLPAYELISYILVFASIPLLSHGMTSFNQQDINVIILTILSLYSGFFAALIWNDITDEEIDKIVHPDRPIPSNMIHPRKLFSIALFFSIITFIFSFLVNLKFFIAVILLAFFVAVHNKYLKKKITFPAYSEIFTPIQWSMLPILGYLSFNTLDRMTMILLVLFTYFSISSHDIIDGIHDYEGDKKNGVYTYANSFGIQNAFIISRIWFIVTGVLGVLIFLFSSLSYVFLICFILLWFYLFFHYMKLTSKDISKGEINQKISRISYNYFLFTFSLIFIDIIIQLYT